MCDSITRGGAHWIDDEIEKYIGIVSHRMHHMQGVTYCSGIYEEMRGSSMLTNLQDKYTFLLTYYSIDDDLLEIQEIISLVSHPIMHTLNVLNVTSTLFLAFYFLKSFLHMTWAV